MIANPESTGAKFDRNLFIEARNLTWRALSLFNESLTPGISESQAVLLIEKILSDLGTTKRWHKSHVRFGKNTLKSFSEKSDTDPILEEDAIYFVDIGPVFNGHEGDCGMTWARGNDPKKKACAKDVKTIFDAVAAHWKLHKATGEELYQFAEKETRKKGWVLSTHKAPGHRLCDFPHQIHHKGKLSDFKTCPSEGLWVLEIQIEDPKGAYGAFYEDLLF